MKPTRNHRFCIDCNRPKMLFPSQEKAERFIRFNADEIYETTGKRLVRAYFCIACGGWHVTSRPLRESIASPVERYFNEKEKALEKKALLEEYDSLFVATVSDLSTLLKDLTSQMGRLLTHKLANGKKCETIINRIISIFETLITSFPDIFEQLKKYYKKFLNQCELYSAKQRRGNVYYSLTTE